MECGNDTMNQIILGVQLRVNTKFFGSDLNFDDTLGGYTLVL